MFFDSAVLFPEIYPKKKNGQVFFFLNMYVKGIYYGSVFNKDKKECLSQGNG